MCVEEGRVFGRASLQAKYIYRLERRRIPAVAAAGAVVGVPSANKGVVVVDGVEGAEVGAKGLGLAKRFVVVDVVAAGTAGVVEIDGVVALAGRHVLFPNKG